MSKETSRLGSSASAPAPNNVVVGKENVTGLMGSEFRLFTPPLREPAAVGVAGAAGQFNGFGEIYSHFARRVGVRSERDRDTLARRQAHDLRAGIDLFAILAQT